MFLTENEAMEKACCKCVPYSDAESVRAPSCLGSICMAFRWEMGAFHFDKQRFLEEGEGVSKGQYEMRSTGRGYCGLAGTPEY